MFCVYDRYQTRIGTLIKLSGGFVNLAFNRRYAREYHDYCSTRENVWAYLQRNVPGCVIKVADRDVDGRLRGGGNVAES